MVYSIGDGRACDRHQVCERRGQLSRRLQYRKHRFSYTNVYYIDDKRSLSPCEYKFVGYEVSLRSRCSAVGEGDRWRVGKEIYLLHQGQKGRKYIKFIMSDCYTLRSVPVVNYICTDAPLINYCAM